AGRRAARGGAREDRRRHRGRQPRRGGGVGRLPRLDRPQAAAPQRHPRAGRTAAREVRRGRPAARQTTKETPVENLIEKLDFLAVPSTDAERSRAFYVETLGL